MRLAAIAALAAALAGCTPMEWVRPDGVTPAQFERDMAQCRQDAWREAQWRSWAYRPLSPIFVRDRAGGPFAFWPYGPYADPFYDPFVEEQRLTDFCLRAKGYQLVPAEPKK